MGGAQPPILGGCRGVVPPQAALSSPANNTVFSRLPGMSDPQRSVLVMNISRRLPGRRGRSLHSGDQCPGRAREAGGAGPDPERTAYLSWVAATVGEHGWAISGRHGDEMAPPWAYSVGMWLTCQAPELVVCGLPVERAAAIINAI